MTQNRSTAVIRKVEIGPATLYLGDAYAIRPAIGRMDCDCMDPQYLFDNSGGGQFRKTREGANAIVELGLDQGFDHKIICPLLAPSIVVFCHNDQLHDLLPYIAGLYRRYAVLFWSKPNPSPMRNKHYLADTEPYIHAWNEGYEPVGEHHDMHRWVHSGTIRTAAYGHPTVKPDAVMDKILRNVSGERICDPFMGTGSTGVAAIKAGKRFVGIEKEERWFNVAVERISAAVEAARHEVGV